MNAGEGQQAITEAGGHDSLHRHGAVNPQRERHRWWERIAAERHDGGRQTFEFLAGQLAAFEQGIARRTDQEDLLDNKRFVIEVIIGLRRGDDGEIEFATLRIGTELTRRRR